MIGLPTVQKPQLLYWNDKASLNKQIQYMTCLGEFFPLPINKTKLAAAEGNGPKPVKFC